MAISIEVEVDRTGEWRRAFDAAILKGLEGCGLACEGYAKKACPVDTGRLRNSITHELLPGERAVKVGPHTDYAIYVELGTSRARAQPYLRPALADHVPKYAKIIRSALSGK